MPEEITEDTTAGTPAEDTAIPPKPTDPPLDVAAEIERLRAELADAAPIVQAHKDAEEAQKSEMQKLRDQLDAIQTERDTAQRGLMLREVAEETGLSSDVVALLQGGTKDDLLTAARKVAETSKRAGVGARPNPRIGGGADAAPTDSESFDPAKLAAAIAKRVRF